MKENDVFYINILEIGLSQMYLNQDKINNILTWFNPLKFNEYKPLPVRDFMDNGKFVLTDGHSRAFVAYKSGIKKIPVMIDNDEIVTCDLGKKLYKEYIDWCNRFAIYSIKDLEQKDISRDEYEFLWIKRCDRLYNLMTAIDDQLLPLQDYKKLVKFGKNRDLFIYGANEELSCYYYENQSGDLWIYKDSQFIHEYSKI